MGGKCSKVTPEKLSLLSSRKKKLYTHCFQGDPYKLKFDNIIFCYADCFPKAAEAINARTTDWSSGTLTGYQTRSFIQNNWVVLITKHRSLKRCYHFLLFLSVIFYDNSTNSRALIGCFLSSISGQTHKANRNFPIPHVAKKTAEVTSARYDRYIKAIRLEQTRRIFPALLISDLTSPRYATCLG